jgi:hypothetical protein
MYDKFEQIAATAQVCAAVLGNPLTGDFVLLPLTGEPISRPDLVRLMLSGLRLCGVVGLVDGCQRTALSEPIEDADMRSLAEGFALYCVQVFAEREREGHIKNTTAQDDSEQWLRRLWALEDSRTG